MDKVAMAMIEVGRKLSDGHFTLFAFTTHWATFSTPINNGSYPNEIQEYTPYKTPEEAVKSAFCELMKDYLERDIIVDKFDLVLSKKLDCIMYLLEN
jgi:hypothetical protein